MNDLEQMITSERLCEAGDTLSSFSAALNGLQMVDDSDERAQAVALLAIGMVHGYVAELARHLADGMEIHAALRATLRGELKLTAEQSNALNEMRRHLSDPTRHN